MPTDANNADLPSTLKRSPAKAQRTFEETLESAEDRYNGDEERAHRTAYASLKHSFEKVGDHWEAKDDKGPSDAQAEQSGVAARDRPKPTAEGVDAIKKANRNRSAQARK
ncbi:MAG: ChaB family protein [Actinomycetota bacterium]|nr:ChaB family protein [Actinomycetota bacterium]